VWVDLACCWRDWRPAPVLEVALPSSLSLTPVIPGAISIPAVGIVSVDSPSFATLVWSIVLFAVSGPSSASCSATLVATLATVAFVPYWSECEFLC